MAEHQNISIEQYLAKVGAFAGDSYGRQIRSRFKDTKGTSELAMLASPTEEEFQQLKKAVAVMTPSEKQNAQRLSDEQVAKIAADAGIDPGNFAIFINGYAIRCKRVS